MHSDDIPDLNQGFREIFPDTGNSSRLSAAPAITLNAGGTSHSFHQSPNAACAPVESYAKEWFNTMVDQTKSNSEPKRKRDGTSGSCRAPESRRTKTDQRYVDITAMIRSLQRTEGLADCFRSGLGDCEQLECVWRKYCVGNTNLK